ncbi:aminotransferase class V-fold PLP-dependent enzyme [Oceanibacterium hippocampi]|uniref:Isopenicillin N epimerase n=1 Tax=Oceanibacterium hippocampi TaxID=745714 RepID=A0A1Y5TY41_9PROT|nr:aminotransferase class V-fold PLP-dependent enzyme [Oceanibacterium hippocampi]SLN73129.1 Isopenicillin N epimerase [Oceanibacterium hippocampi]
MIPNQRHLFEIPEDVAYLNCAYMAPLMRSVRTAGERGVALKSSPWELTPGDFFSQSETARGLFATLIGATADDVAIIPSASYGIEIAARNLPLARGTTILMLADQFPSNVYPWQARARETGAAIHSVARPADGDWTAAILAALESVPAGGLAVAALPHCHWTDGGLVDLALIAPAVRDRGGRLVLDVTQSLGALPLDVGEIRPDYLVAASYKWLLGPYSLGFAYVAPEHQGGRPLEQTWIGRAGSEDFAGLVAYREDRQPGARSFDVGERANFALMPMAIAALRQILDWGTAEIQATLRAMTDSIAEGARSHGLIAADGSNRAGHFLGLRFPDGPPDGLLARLAAEKIFVSQRGDAMRVTPHLYNNQRDIDRLLAAIGRL